VLKVPTPPPEEVDDFDFEATQQRHALQLQQRLEGRRKARELLDKLNEDILPQTPEIMIELLDADHIIVEDKISVPEKPVDTKHVKAVGTSKQPSDHYWSTPAYDPEQAQNIARKNGMSWLQQPRKKRRTSISTEEGRKKKKRKKRRDVNQSHILLCDLGFNGDSLNYGKFFTSKVFAKSIDWLARESDTKSKVRNIL
jgi:hypothetical protein